MKPKSRLCRLYDMARTLVERDRKAVEGITCPVCSAPPGESCSFENRWERRTAMKHPHKERVTSWEHRVWIRGKQTMS